MDYVTRRVPVSSHGGLRLGEFEFQCVGFVRAFVVSISPVWGREPKDVGCRTRQYSAWRIACTTFAGFCHYILLLPQGVGPLRVARDFLPEESDYNCSVQRLVASQAEAYLSVRGHTR